MNDQERLYLEALSAVENDQRARARDLLARLIKLDASRPEYWLCMSGVVQTRKEQIYCLKEVLRLDPENEMATLGLSIYGIALPGSKPRVRNRLEAREWQPAGMEAFQNPKGAGWFTWQFGLGILGILSILAIGFFIFRGIVNRKNTLEPITLLITAGPSPTYLPTQTPPASLLTASPDGTESLGAQLNAEYTPTPLFVQTPHPASEDFRMAMRALERQDWEGMVASLGYAATNQPDAADLDYYTGEAHRFMGEYSQAIKAYDRALSKDPEFAAPHLGKARILIAQGSSNYRAARLELDSALGLDANMHESWLETAYLDLQQQDPENALDALNQVEALAPGSTLLHYYRGLAKMMLDQPAEALKSARQAVENDVTFLPAYRLVGESALAAGEPQIARQALELFLQYSVGDDQAMVWLADVYTQLNNPVPAMDLYDQALDINTRSYGAWIGRGRLNYSTGNFTAADSDLRKALVYDSRSFEAHLLLGMTLFALEDPGDAYQELSRAQAFAESPQDNAAVYFWRGQALEELDQDASARRDWQALLALPNDDNQIPEDWLLFAQQRLQNKATATVRSTAPNSTQQP